MTKDRKVSSIGLRRAKRSLLVVNSGLWSN